jgi:hypothetical protein
MREEGRFNRAQTRKNERKRRGNEKEKRGEERSKLEEMINERRGEGKGGRNVRRKQAQLV